MKNSGVSKVSVVVTVINEADNIKNLISALEKQTLRPFEIIFVDGGSTDETYKILKKVMPPAYYKRGVRGVILQKPGNRSLGRNFGVSQAKGDLIAFTDAGCLPHPNWLENLIKPFSDPEVQVVSGYYQGISTNIFQKCLIPYVLVMPDKAGKKEFYPATRSMAIRKSVFLSSGGFAENLSHNEDYAFAHHLKKLGYSFFFAPQAVVDWFPRKNLKSAAWMFMRFAIGDLQAGIIRPQLKPLVIRYIVFLYLFFLAPYFYPIFYLLLTITLLYLLYSIIKNFKYVKDLRALFWLPVLQITCDLSILFGSLVGFLSRIWT